jgi:2'-5' RNA ligase
MQGVISLLDEQHDTLVRELWAELAGRFGLGAYVTPIPHFSYQIAAQYDSALLAGILERAASRAAPFHVQTTGLGIFTGVSPVLYIPVVRSLELSQLHQRLWGELAGAAGQQISDLYHPDQWMPHITIGIGDLDKARLAEVILLLSERSFNWTITINNLAFAEDTGTEQLLHARCNLSA